MPDNAQKPAAKAHSLQLSEHRLLTVTGVKAVPTFTDKLITVELEGETLSVTGHDHALFHRARPLIFLKAHLQMTAGASWTAQLAAALIAAAFGVAASPLTLLYKVSARPVTRIAADFVATVGIALLFLLSAETGAEGRLTLYCAACYLVALAFAGKGVTV